MKKLLKQSRKLDSKILEVGLILDGYERRSCVGSPNNPLCRGLSSVLLVPKTKTVKVYVNPCKIHISYYDLYWEEVK